MALSLSLCQRNPGHTRTGDLQAATCTLMPLALWDIDRREANNRNTGIRLHDVIAVPVRHTEEIELSQPQNVMNH